MDLYWHRRNPEENIWEDRTKTLTVQDLIRYLERFPKDLKVGVGCDGIINEMSMMDIKRGNEYLGAVEYAGNYSGHLVFEA